MDIGDGCSALFWEDRWLRGYQISEIAPTIYDRISARVRSNKKVFDALNDGSCPADTGPEMDSAALEEYLQLCLCLAKVQLDRDATDTIRWSWELSGELSIRSAYAAKFAVREVEPYTELAWGSRAPRQCRFFAWLDMRNRC